MPRTSYIIPSEPTHEPGDRTTPAGVGTANTGFEGEGEDVDTEEDEEEREEEEEGWRVA